MIALGEHAEGLVLPVRAQPGAKRNAIVGEVNGALKVAVTAPADQGKANRAIVEVLCDAWKLRPWQIELIAGLTNRDKKLLIRGVERPTLEALLG